MYYGTGRKWQLVVVMVDVMVDAMVDVMVDAMVDVIVDAMVDVMVDVMVDSRATVVVRVKRKNNGVKATFSRGKGKIRYSESRAGFGF
jgi:hypothetical protein